MDIEKMYDTGFQAYERGNYEYAIEMFKRITALEPDHVKARKALRATERKMQGKSKPGFGASLKAAGLQMKAQLLTAKKEFRKIMELCEQYLVKDPYNKTVLLVLGQAALKGSFPDTAVMTFEDLIGTNSKDKKILRLLARSYTEKNDYENAIKNWQRLLKEHPSDNKAKEEVKNLAAKQSLDETWDKEGGKRDFTEKVRDTGLTKRLVAQDLRIRTAAELDEAIEYAKADHEKDPGNLRLIMKVGDLLRQKEATEEAKQYFEKALEIDPAYFHARLRLGDLEISRLTKATEDALAKLRANPGDPFQRACKDPKFRNVSLFYLGRCFIKREEFATAVEPLTEVIDSLHGMDDMKKNALYYRADAYEGVGDKVQALRDLKTIYLEDIEFKVKDKGEDIAARIKRIEESGPGEIDKAFE
jgi:tetratricopeptide (TPR) repeat protein